MAKLTFDEVMDRVNEDREVKASEVRADVLARKIWIASNGMVGCMNDSSNVCLTKQDAIDTCLLIADSGEGYPKGMKTALKNDGRFSEDGYYVYRVERATVGELL